MSHRHKSKIEKVFEHPISANIDVKKLISALEHYGVEIEVTKKHKVKLFYREKEFVLSLPHDDHLSKDETVRLRHFLEEVELTPDRIQ
ncbi:hypothetical protein [Hydrogenimonas sp.]|uniref:hypothetical protein n=1 Tax=Hydrogenimonas sp. TaxID=2231112 RepID=UPI002631BDA7|nr:hypothetical protein [Hydrogenimonas sp.]